MGGIAELHGDSAIFRCDGGIDTGLGHVSRCVALAEALAERSVSSLFVGEFSSDALALLASAGVECMSPFGTIGSHTDCAGMDRLAEQLRPVGVIVDSYRVDASYLERLNERSAVVVLDDFARLPAYPCAAVLNFTVSAPFLHYPSGPAKRLLGLDYTLTRQALRRLGRKPPPVPVGQSVLIAIGGVDRHGLMSRILEAIAPRHEDLEVRAIVPGDSANRSALEPRIRTFRSGRLIGPCNDLSPHYSWADTLITGGGLMKYEAATIGLPTGVLPQTDGEAADVQRFAALGLAVDLGGPAVTERPLLGPLHNLLTDATLRRALHDASSRAFAHGTTLLAADRILSLCHAWQESNR